jgi:hypothetical protein
VGEGVGFKELVKTVGERKMFDGLVKGAFFHGLFYLRHG